MAKPRRLRKNTYRATPGDEPPASHLLPPDMIAHCGGLRQAIAEILRWKVPAACCKVAIAILCRQRELRDGKGQYSRCSYRTLNRYIGRTDASKSTGQNVARLEDEGLLWVDRTIRNAPLYYFRRPERTAESSDYEDDASTPREAAGATESPTPTTVVPVVPPAPPIAGLAMSDLSKEQLADVTAAHGGFMASIVAAAHRNACSEKVRAARGDTPLVYELCELLGRGDRHVWCAVQATVTRARRAGDMKGSGAYATGWLVGQARMFVRDRPVNPAAVFVKWFRNQATFARHWKAQTKGATDAPKS